MAADVDGDGDDDEIRIEPPGALIITTSRGASSRLPLDDARGALRASELALSRDRKGQLIIVAQGFFDAPPTNTTTPATPPTSNPSTTAGADDDDPLRHPPDLLRHRHGVALLAAWRGGRLVELWRGPVGAQGAHGEYRVHLEATAQRIWRYQTRPEVRRCDGRAGYLFPEAWDGQFRPIYNLPRVPADAPLIQAQRQPPAGVSGAPASSFRSRAASTQAGARDAGELAPPRELDDGDVTTVWRESLGGDGRGEFITFGSNIDAPRVAAIRIIPGDASSPTRFRRANRLRRAGLLIGAEVAYRVAWPDDPGRDPEAAAGAPYWLVLPQPVAASCVTLVIESVYPGDPPAGAGRARAGGGETAIAELSVLTELDLTPGGSEAALVALVVAGEGPGRRAARLLAERGQAGAEATLAALADPARSAAEQLRLRRVLAKLGDPAGAGELVEGMAAVTTPDADRADFGAALAAMGTAAVPVLAALLVDAEAPDDARAAAVSALVAIAHDDADQALLAAAGAGPRPLRKQIAQALAVRLGLDALLAAARATGPEASDKVGAEASDGTGAEASDEAGREADLWRALGYRARRAAAAERARAESALRARLADASGYELRYRLLAALAPIASPAGLDELAAMLAAPASDPEQIALRRVAVDALAENPAPQARALLRTALADADPGLRRHAAEALGGRDDADDGTDRDLAARLDEDAWPRIRRAAAGALARRCDRSDAAAGALRRAVGGDRDPAVRRGALTALVSCHAPGVGKLLLEVADATAQPSEVRQRAITLLAVLGDTEHAAALAGLFEELRRRAWSDENALALATAAAVAIGRLGHDSAVEPLIASARDPAFPELQAAAITGLGEMCAHTAGPAAESARSVAARARAVIEPAVTSNQRVVVIAARGARARCR